MKRNVLFIASTGGHLHELMQLSPMFNNYNYHIITEKTKSNLKLKNKYHEKISYLVYGTKDHMLTYPAKLLYNCFKSLYFYIKYHPDYIITTGTHTAGPICCIGKILGSKIIYIETFANITTKTATGKLLYKIADHFIVQWPSMKKLYPKAIDGGWIY
ncbi:MAG TPA: polysaccharide biosynthesis protein [Candidatus Faecimonas gallistercoris]|nr:polysaccharide biosynthesis protein [Candidatus Faecimonas gallistercoris]